jgi:DNA repair protein RadC
MNRASRYHVALARESEMTFATYPRFSNSRDCLEAFRVGFAACDREEFHVMALESKNRMIGLHYLAT